MNSAEKGVLPITRAQSSDPAEITWDGPDDPENPLNWPTSRKIPITLLVSLAQLICISTASVVAPALPQIASDLGLGELESQISFSIFILGQAFGPFVIGPLSEVFGRKPLWVGCTAFYILWNSLCPVGKSKPILIVGRLLSGAGASCGVILSGPIVADMYHVKDRGKSLALAGLFPYLGPALGPIIGGLASQHLSWPWLFWVMSISAAVVVLAGVIYLRETYAPMILHKKAIRLHGKSTRSSAQDHLWPKIRVSLQRPLRLLIFRPVIQLLALALAVDFGIYILVLSFFARVFTDQYNQDTTASSLHYIAIGLGTTIAAQAGGQAMDILYGYLKRRQPEGHAPTPEFRVPLLLIGFLMGPIGLFWLGWSAQARVAWIMVDIGAAIFTIGSFVGSQAILAYLLDEFGGHAASASAAVRMLSNVFGFAFPLCAPQLFDGLGYGWGNSVLAFVWIGVLFPVPVLLWFGGAQIRALGKRES
ncbi:MFS general substrate transporter [Aspergillus cavernicola]|uniref:MFS general substrate transporter n=1 Tax=Aspergillus cavernicola TaxID=176166 RepID=A0ABR4I2S1_9EURO